MIGSDEQYLAPIRARSMVENVVSRITGAIMSGELKPGEKIPTEAEMVRAFGVGRNTVREAVKMLESYGILEIRRADGTYVCDRFSPRLLDPMLYGIILQKESAHHDLVGLREMLDGAILQQLYYKGVAPETWETLGALQDDLEDYLSGGGRDIAIIARKDAAFHQSLAAATNNIAVMTVYDSILKITEDFLFKTIETILQYDAVSYFSESHRGIMKALAGDSPDALFRCVEWSYRYWQTSFEEEQSDQR